MWFVFMLTGCAPTELITTKDSRVEFGFVIRNQSVFVKNDNISVCYLVRVLCLFGHTHSDNVTQMFHAESRPLMKVYARYLLGKVEASVVPSYKCPLHRLRTEPLFIEANSGIIDKYMIDSNNAKHAIADEYSLATFQTHNDLIRNVPVELIAAFAEGNALPVVDPADPSYGFKISPLGELVSTKHCGVWESEYSAFHKEMLASKRPKKMVMVPHRSG